MYWWVRERSHIRMVTFTWAERTVTRNMEGEIFTSPQGKNTWGSLAEGIFMEKASSTVKTERCCTMESGIGVKDVIIDLISSFSFIYQDEFV